MSTLVTVHLYGYFRTNQGADSAAGAFAVIIESSRQIASSIESIGARDYLFGAERDADLASFTEFLRNGDKTFHLVALWR
jgi:hypothetical protein